MLRCPHSRPSLPETPFCGGEDKKLRTHHHCQLPDVGWVLRKDEERGENGGKTGKIAARSGKSKQGEQSLPLYSLLPRNCISLSQIFIAPLGQEQQLVVANALAATDFPSKCGQPQKRSGKVVTRIRALERAACCCCRRH